MSLPRHRRQVLETLAASFGNLVSVAERQRYHEECEEGIQWPDRFAELLDDPRAGEVEGLVIGPWGEVSTGTDSAPVVEALVASARRLPRLRALFFGDILMEESEISWIIQSDLSPLFPAFPMLEHFVCGAGRP